MQLLAKHVDAFTTTPLTGNPAGVVMDAHGLNDGQMQAIAREMAHPETAFVLPPSSHAADLRIRWFSPAVEIPLCGHATVGAFHALAESGLQGMAAVGSYAFRLETLSGILPVRVEKGVDGTEVSFGLPVPEFTRAGQYKLDVMRVLNVPLEEFDSHFPIVIAGDLFVPVKRLHTLFGMKPNMSALEQFLSNRKMRGLCVFTQETVERSSAFHSRFFAPHLGINEDPVTGSANGPLAAYLFERGALDASEERLEVVGEQGDAIGRPGRVRVRLTVHGAQVMTVEIGGRAVTIMEGTLRVD
jgi:PhzF family phenazine biosynthesis protein